MPSPQNFPYLPSADTLTGSETFGAVQDGLPVGVTADQIATFIQTEGGIGPEDLVLDVYNATGGTLAAGTLVYVSGYDATTGRYKVAKADADSSTAGAAVATYLVTTAITNSASGRVYRSGTATGLDTSSTAVGDPVYLSTTAGAITKTAPTGADDVVQIVGRVTAVDGSAGTALIDLTSNGVQKIATNQYQTASIPQAALVENSLNGTVAANVATDNVVGGIPVVHMITIADGASGDTDVTLTHKTRVIDAWVVLTAAGDPANTYTVKNAGNAITDAITPGATDTTLARAGQINDANWDIAAAGTLRVSHVRTGGSSAAVVFVKGIRVA